MLCSTRLGAGGVAASSPPNLSSEVSNLREKNPSEAGNPFPLMGKGYASYRFQEAGKVLLG